MPTRSDVVRIPIPTRLHAGTVNAYLLLGEPLTLVDPGPSTREAREALLSGLQGYGYRLQDVRQIVVTHHHVDHSGLAGWVQAASRAGVLAHPAAVSALAEPRIELLRWVRLLLDLGRLHKIPEDDLVYVHSALIQAGGMAEPVTVDTDLRDGTHLAAGGSHWQVLHTPGHSRSQLALFRPGDGVLIAGDHLLPDGPSATLLEPFAPGRTRPNSMQQYLRSLTRVAGLSVSTVYPGHGGRMRDAGEAAAARVHSLESKIAAARALLGRERLTAYELCRRMFPDTGPAVLLYTLSITLGILDVLEARGLVAATRATPVLYRDQAG